jgi:hypothetical protein
MLVLSRRIYERIRIGDDIIITIVRIDRGVVSVGIEAPRHLKIDRLPPNTEWLPKKEPSAGCGEATKPAQ